MNFTGWKTFNWTKSNFKIDRWPLGWNSITGVSLSAAWSHTQNATSDLYLDSMMFWRKDGSEIDSTKGLEQYFPKVDHDRRIFYDLNAPSNPASKRHAVSIIRQNVSDPIVQVLRPHTETKFISSFSQSGKSYVIETKTETITVNPGDLESEAPCSSVTRRQTNKKGTLETTQLACKSISLSDSDRKLTIVLFSTEGSVISLQQKGDSVPKYNSAEESVTFENVKLPGKKTIGLNVTACSGVNGLSVQFNGKPADVLKGESTDKNNCLTETFTIKLDASPCATGDLTVILKEFV